MHPGCRRPPATSWRHRALGGRCVCLASLSRQPSLIAFAHPQTRTSSPRSRLRWKSCTTRCCTSLAVIPRRPSDASLSSLSFTSFALPALPRESCTIASRLVVAKYITALLRPGIEGSHETRTAPNFVARLARRKPVRAPSRNELVIAARVSASVIASGASTREESRRGRTSSAGARARRRGQRGAYPQGPCGGAPPRCRSGGGVATGVNSPTERRREQRSDARAPEMQARTSPAKRRQRPSWPWTSRAVPP